MNKIVFSFIHTCQTGIFMGHVFGRKGQWSRGGLHIKSFCSQNESLDSFCKYGIRIETLEYCDNRKITIKYIGIFAFTI